MPHALYQGIIMGRGGARDERLRKKKAGGQSKVGRLITIIGARWEPIRETSRYHEARLNGRFPDTIANAATFQDVACLDRHATRMFFAQGECHANTISSFLAFSIFVFNAGKRACAGSPTGPPGPATAPRPPPRPDAEGTDEARAVQLAALA